MKASNLFINSSLAYKICQSEKPGHSGFPYAFWLLLHYITAQTWFQNEFQSFIYLNTDQTSIKSTDGDARTCASIISNFCLVFYPDKRFVLSFARKLSQGFNNFGSYINEAKLYGETHDSKYPYTNVNSQFDLIDWLWNIHRGFIAERPKEQNDIKD